MEKNMQFGTYLLKEVNRLLENRYLIINDIKYLTNDFEKFKENINREKYNEFYCKISEIDFDYKDINIDFKKNMLKKLFFGDFH